MREPLMGRQFARPIDRLADAEEWITARDADRMSGEGYAFAIVDERDEPLGNVAVTDVDPRHLTGWVSYWVLGPARGRGLATRACRALARWAFAELGLFRLELGHRTDNPASCRVALGAGFLAEGIERAKLRYGDERFDVERHARLATDPDPAP